MVRVKRGLIKKRRHNKILASTKGYRGTKSRLVRVAKEAAMHAGEYAFAGRKDRKSQKRSLWIVQINAALGPSGLSYNRFVNGLKRAKIEIDRKILADLALSDPDTFKQVVDTVEKSLAKKMPAHP